MRTADIPWKRIHGSVYFLVNLDKGEIRVNAIIHRESDDSISIARFAPDIRQSPDLHQFAPEWSDNHVLKFAGLRSGREVVFTLEEGKAMWNYVTTGIENLDSREILEGLTAGQTVITDGNENLAHQTPVIRH